MSKNLKNDIESKHEAIHTEFTRLEKENLLQT